MLYYKGKSRNIDEIIEASMHLYAPIEIIPFDQNRFDIIKFIEFADALTKDYVCSYFSNTHYQIELYAHYAELDDASASFIIKINKNFSDIKVYIQDAIHLMKIDEKDHINCIVLEKNSFKANEFSVFNDDSYILNKRLGEKNSVLFNFGQFVANKRTISPIFLKKAFQCFQHPKNSRRSKSTFSSFQNMDSLIAHLLGYVYYTYQESPNQLPENVFNSSLITVDDKPKIITSFLWLLPYAISTIYNIHLIEIDASFKACKPFKYCIYQGIYYNASIPLALSFAPEESQSLYELIFTGCKKHQLKCKHLEGINVLSDMGISIKAFCDSHNMIKNFCHRYIIEHFGARSVFGIWARRLLKCKTYEEYLMRKEFISSELNEYESKIMKIKKLERIEKLKKQTGIENIEELEQL